jgi:molybdenum cofactor biosynthesis enzyme
MTQHQLDQLIAETDAAIDAHNAKVETRAITGMEIEAVITIGITVLTAVKALLWWKPKWQTAVGNVILYLQTFEAVTAPAA